MDLWFFFETLAKCWRPFVGKHYDLARQMCDYLANFCKHGDPNGSNAADGQLPYWPVFTPEAPVMMSFADTVKPVHRPMDPVARLLLEAYFRRMERQ